MTNELPPESMNEIIELIYTNQKLEAVKRYKKLRGMSLMESKEFIEQLTEKLKAESPENFLKVRNSSGCAGLLALAAFSLACLALMLHVWQ